MATSLNTELLFLDGGMGTYLEDRHEVIFDDHKPGWSSNVDPTVLRQVHEEYAEFADVLLSATYQGTHENMDPIGSQGSALEGQNAAQNKMHELVNVCRSAAAESDRHPARKVALSLGPYGATMIPSTEYSGEYPVTMQDHRALKKWHSQRISKYFEKAQKGQAPTDSTISQAWTDISYVAFETLVSITEISAVRSAMHDLNNVLNSKDSKGQPKPFWVSANFPKGTIDEPLTPSMDGPKDVACEMAATRKDFANPWGIGVNCTSIYKIDAIIRGFEHALGLNVAEPWPFLVLYPDGAQNLRYNTTTKTWDPVGDALKDDLTWAAQMEALLRTIMKRGKWPGILVGGCCKTTPSDIAELRQRMTRS